MNFFTSMSKKCSFEGCNGKDKLNPRWKTHTTIDSCPNKKCTFPYCNGTGNKERGDYHNDLKFCPLFEIATTEASELLENNKVVKKSV